MTSTNQDPHSEFERKIFNLSNYKQHSRLILAISSLALILFFMVATIAPFRDKLFQYLYPKPSSRAASATFGLTAPGTPNYPQTGPLQKLINPPYSSYNGSPSSLQGAVLIDNTHGYGYYATAYGNTSAYGTAALAIVKFNLASFKTITALVLSGTSIQIAISGVRVGPSAIDVASGYAYFTTSASPAKVFKINLTNFTEESVLTLPAADGVPSSAAIDTTNHFLYLGTSYPQQGVVQINLSTFTVSSFLSLPLTTHGVMTSLLLDASNSFAYACSTNIWSEPMVVGKVQLSGLTSTATLTLPYSSYDPRGGCSYGGFIDNSNGYIDYGASSADPTKIIQVRLSDFTATTSASILVSGESGIVPIGLDSNRGLAFFATNVAAYPYPKAELIETNSQNLSRIGSLPNINTLSTPNLTVNPSTSEIYSSHYALLMGADLSTLFTKLSYTQSFKGKIEGSKVNLTETAPVVSSFSFYSQTASSSAKLRLALYNSGKTLLWQSGAVPQTVNGGWQTVDVSSGTPNSLTTLLPGDYYLAWQTDSDFPTASYTQGSMGDGFELPQAFGDFPANISGETSTSSKWSIYGSYSSALITPTPTPASVPNSIDNNLWGANGYVTALLKTSNGIYLGGFFDSIGPNTGPGVPLDKNGMRLPNFAKVNSSVKSAISDGNGGWYIGGSFNRVGSLDREWVAHIKPDGSVDPSFNANIDGTYNPGISGPDAGYINYEDGIAALALSPDKSTLYIGGGWWLGQTFTIAGQVRNNIAAVDAVTGALKPWAPTLNDGIDQWPYSMAVSPDGSVLYVGGIFTSSWGRTNYRNLYAIDAATGNKLSWNPPIDGTVNSVALSSDGKTIYAGGSFDSLSGNPPAPGLAKIDTSTGTLDANFNSTDARYATAMVLSKDNSTLYVGGYGNWGSGFMGVGALDAFIGALKPFQVSVGHDTYALALSPDESTLYIGGNFGEIGGTDNRYLAAANISSSTITSWNPTSTNTIWALATNSTGTAVFAGGDGYTTSIGNGQVAYRPGLAKLKNDGTVDLAFNPNVATSSASWNISGSCPDPTNSYCSFWGTIRAFALSKDGSTLYLGGDGFQQGTQVRNDLAAVDATSATLLSFNPNVSGANGRLPYHYSTVMTMALSPDNSTLYFGGNFASVSGQLRNNLAAVNTATGTPTAFNPNPGPNPSGTLYINAHIAGMQFSSDGQTLYVSGMFTQIGGRSLPGVAALDPTSGNATSWSPAAGWGSPIALSPDNSTLYVGTLGGFPASEDILALNTTTGNGLSLNADTGGLSLSTCATSAMALSCSGNTLFVSGEFTSIGGQDRYHIAALDTTSYNTLPWSPIVSAGTVVSPISVDCTATCPGGTATPSTSDYAVYIGGCFNTISGEPIGHLAGEVPVCSVPTPTPTSPPGPTDTPTPTPTPTTSIPTPTPTSSPSGSGGNSSSNPTPTPIPFTPVVPLQGPKTGGNY